MANIKTQDKDDEGTNLGVERSELDQPPSPNANESNDDYFTRLDKWEEDKITKLKQENGSLDYCLKIMMLVSDAKTKRLQANYEELRKLQELQASNAKLQASNEELQANYEELRKLQANYEELRKLQELQASNAKLQASNAKLQASNQEVQKKFPCFREIAKESIRIANETDSSAHTHTGHTLASHEIISMPTVELPESFWEHRPRFHFPTQINSEQEVNANLGWLLRDVAEGLKLGSYLTTMLNNPVMNTSPDVTLITKENKRMAGIIEGEKPPRTSAENAKIFGTDTDVARKAFEKLFLVTLQNDSFAVGLISTLQTVQLICTEDISKEKLTANDAIGYFTAQKQDTPPAISPDKPKILAENTPTAADNGPKKLEVELTHQTLNNKKRRTKKKKKSKKKSKNGRISAAIATCNIERKFFATKPISFSSEEADNRKVFELLACYVLLGVKSLERAPKISVDLSRPGTCCLARKFTINKEFFTFKELRLQSGVQFNTQPRKNHSVFFVIRQLGYGKSGACCFACTQATSAPCVIKFFRQGRTLADAEAEAANWRTLYNDLGFDFVRAAEKPRVLLVIPYLRVPCNLAERKQLVQGGQKSLLYNALQHIATKGYIHKEVFWHHIGLIDVSMEDQRLAGMMHNKTDVTSSTKIAIFCDLSHIEQCTNLSEQKAWVTSSFNNLMNRMGP